MGHPHLPVAAGGLCPLPVAGAPLLCDAREHGLTGDGTTNDQPAFAALDLVSIRGNRIWDSRRPCWARNYGVDDPR